MPNKTSNQHRSLSAGWALLALIAAFALLGILIWRGLRKTAPDADGIAIVHAPNVVPQILPVPARPTPTRTTGYASSPEVAAAHVRQAYWVLSDVALSCDGDRCVLNGTIRPPTGQTEVDKRQEMLLGGLASVLAEDGYTMHVPFRMVEIDDNKFDIKASVTRVTPLTST